MMSNRLIMNSFTYNAFKSFSNECPINIESLSKISETIFYAYFKSTVTLHNISSVIPLYLLYYK